MELLPYKQICKCCNINFRSKGPNKLFCTKECKIKWNIENIYTYSFCKVCGNSMRVSIKNKNTYCSKECYGSRMKTHPTEFGMSERASKMRESWDETSWKKGIQTRTDNGNIINWDVAEWKQYWRRCNDLTRKIRKQMLEGWDGFDYIDGEYIKDNLNLHYTHGSYPTLDHVIPRSQGFKEKISPYEITKPENLKWTKRSNNSKKYFN